MVVVDLSQWLFLRSQVLELWDASASPGEVA